jgi:6-pyruvoyl-tetrahydropterin synthase
MVFVLICIVVLTIIILTVIYVAVILANPAKQQLTLTVPLTDTYRYSDRKAKIDYIKITVKGNKNSKKDKSKPLQDSSTIIENIIRETIVEQYQGSLLVQESQLFTVQDDDLKRRSVPKLPTLENLAELFDVKLAPLLNSIGYSIVSIKLSSEGLRVSHTHN